MFLCSCLFCGFLFGLVGVVCLLGDFFVPSTQLLIFLLTLPLGFFFEVGSEKLVFLGYRLEQRNPKFLQAAFIKTVQTKRLGRAWRRERLHRTLYTLLSSRVQWDREQVLVFWVLVD